jgi:hypothetical protein
MNQLSDRVSSLILYTVLFDQQLDEATVAYVARRAAEHPQAYLTTDEIYAGIAGALQSDAVLTGAQPGNRHGEQEYRDFLRRLLGRLDDLRPWPELPFRAVDPSSWPDLGAAQPVARIRVSFVQVEHRLKKAFEHVGETRRLLMVLRLKSGTEVALAARWWAGSKDVALLKGDPRLRDRQVVAEFRSLTGFTENEITLLYTPRHGRTLPTLSRPA